MSSDWSGGGEGIAGGGGHSRCSGLCWEVGQVGGGVIMLLLEVLRCLNI